MTPLSRPVRRRVELDKGIAWRLIVGGIVLWAWIMIWTVGTK